MIGTACHMLFTKQEEEVSTIFGAEVRYPDAFFILVKAFLQIRDVATRSFILKAMWKLLALNQKGYLIIRTYLPPFEELFLHFDTLDIENRKYLLSMVDEIVNIAPLLPSEISQFYLLLKGNFISLFIIYFLFIFLYYFMEYFYFCYHELNYFVFFIIIIINNYLSLLFIRIINFLKLINNSIILNNLLKRNKAEHNIINSNKIIKVIQSIKTQRWTSRENLSRKYFIRIFRIPLYI